MSRGKRPPDQPDATITFTYESAYNQIVEPGSYVSLSQYFIAHWLPAISPSGLKILVRLRAMGYYSPKTGAARGDIDIEQKDLAALCGLSLSTLKRAFLDDVVLTRYVQRVFQVKRDPRNGRILKEHYVYVVKMDDALTDADKARLEGMLQGPDEETDPPIGQNDPSGTGPIAQNELSAGQNEPPIVHFEPPTTQNELSLNGSLNTLNTLHTPHTRTAHPGDSPSAISRSSSGEEPKEERTNNNVPWPFDLLSDAERVPWLEKAETELRENFGLAVWAKTKEKAKASIRAQRASNLYLAGKSGETP